MKAVIKRAISKALRKRGYRLQRASIPGYDWNNALRASLSGTDAPLVLDVGTNTGDFIDKVLKAAPRARIHGFEPIPALADALIEKYSSRAQVEIFRYALGAKPSKSPFFVHEYSDASSVLANDRAYAAQYGSYSAIGKEIEIAVDTLDRHMAAHAIPGDAPVDLVKIDVQGFEGRVIRGARATLARTRNVIIEMMFIPTYQDADPLDQLCVALAESGFEFVYAFNVFPASADFYFRRPEGERP